MFADVQRFETVEDVVKHFHLNEIDLLLPDSTKRKQNYRVTLRYHE